MVRIGIWMSITLEKGMGERGNKLTTMQNYSEKLTRPTVLHSVIIVKSTLIQFIHRAGW